MHIHKYVQNLCMYLSLLVAMMAPEENEVKVRSKRKNMEVIFVPWQTVVTEDITQLGNCSDF